MRCTIIAGLVLILAGCTPGPSDQDLSTWSQWQQELLAEPPEPGPLLTGRPVVKANGETTSVRLAAPVRPADVVLQCTGPERMSIGFTLLAATTSDGGSSLDVPCDEQWHSAGMPPSLTGEEIYSISVAATSDRAAGAWALSTR